jgi:tetratricopeptide (TPR) repeat protein
MDANDIESAVGALRKILIRDPNQVSARSSLLDIYLESGQGSRALSQIDWLEKNAPQPNLIDARAIALVTLGRYEEVIAITGGSVKLSEQSANLRAWAYLQLGETDSAQKAYDDFLASFPNNQNAQLGLARVALLANDFTTALPHVMAVLENDQTFADAWLVFGDLLLRMRRYKEAEEAFTRARALDASFLVSATGISRALLYQGQAKAAAETADELRRKFPTIIEVRYLAGEIAEAQNQPDDALRHYQNIVAAQATHYGANLKLGTIAFREGTMSIATLYLSVAINQAPHAIEARLLMAEIERTTGRAESAVEHLAELFSSISESKAGFYSLCPSGPTALSYEEYSGLLELWLTREPNDEAARIKLAIEAEMVGDDATATRHYQLLLDANPDNSFAKQRSQAIRESIIAGSDTGSRLIDREQSDLSGFRCSRD